MSDKIKGFKTYRHNQKPKEKELHDKFINEHVIGEYYSAPVDLIVFPAQEFNDFEPSDELSDREKRIMISTIQWLGSPVGKSFLRGCGFVEK